MISLKCPDGPNTSVEAGFEVAQPRSCCNFNFFSLPASLRKLRRRPRFAKLLMMFLLVCLAAHATLLHAQVYLGSIQGQVIDPSGAKIPNATVTVEDVGTHFKTKATTNAAGTYTLAGLTPGTYVVTSTAQGFKTATRQDVVLASGQLSQVDFSLTLGATSETVEVTADNSLLDTGDANISTTLSHQEVTDLPNVGRNPFVLATLAAGVINGGSGGYFQGHASQYTNPFSGVAVQIASNGSGGHNRITIDGIPDDPAERFSGASYTGFVPSPEAVQEVRVSQSIFDAQVGHGNGTVTDTIVRSGTNKLHGAAYYVFQNTYLNANLYQNVPNQYAATNPTKRNNDQLSQTGIVLAGPVVIPKVYDGRDKTFFMVAFERYASHTAQNYMAQVPTTAELAGDFSGLCNTFNANGLCTSGVQLYVPNSPVDANGNRTQYFPNNNIASAISPVGAAYLTFLPMPNVAGSTNYIATQTSYPSTYPSFITRVDEAVTQKNKLNAIYFQAGLTQNFPLEGFPKGIGPSGFGYHVYRNTRGGSLDDVQQFSSSLVLDSRLGVIFHPFGLAYPGNSGYDLSTLGISSTGLPYDSFPGISLSDPNNSYASLASGASGQVSEDTVGSLDEILTKSIRTHTLRFGFEGNLTRYNVQNPQSGFGSFGFDRRFTQQNSVTASVGSEANSGDALASLELGAFSTATYNITPAYALQQKYSAFFFQDDWRATPKLTLNLGLRWDYESPFTERFNKQVTNFCTTCASPLQASVTGLTLNGGLQYASSSNRTAYPPDYHAWQPRVGAAYQFTPTTVFRAGFGIIYFNTLETPIGTGFSQTTSYTNTSSSVPLNSIANPFPNGVVLPTGSAAGLSTGIGTGITFVDPHHVQPRSAEYTLNVQQQLPGGVSLQIAYVGSRPTRLEVNHNIDLLPQQYYNQGVAGVTYLTTQVNNPLAGKVPANGTLNAAKIQQYYLLLPYPQFSSVQENYSSIGSAPYNALQIQVAHPMRHHISFQGNFTWDKLMQHTAYLDNYAAAGGHLESVQDSSPNMFGNIWGTLELPKFLKAPAYERLAIGGWQLNLVSRLSNGSLINAPGNVNIIGNYRTNQTFYHQFNTCYDSVSTTTGALTPVNTVISSKTGLVTLQGCDANNPTPAFAQRLSYTSQNNSTVLNIRQRLYPLLDASLFKRFIIREGISFEVRGEFFNVLNTAEFGGPNTSLGAANTGSAASNPSAAYPQGQLSEANDARIGQLTVRLNF